MSADFKEVLERALEQAVTQYFCQLFSVLMVKPDVAAMDRFEAGLDKLATTEDAVSKKIGEME